MSFYDFKFKPFDEMTPEDYERVGFKAGLEVHQQLKTEKKLFCRCPSGHYHKEGYHTEILRHMRPTLSELGEYDGTALMEFKTKKEIIYRIHYDTVCTYEMDDTPPFEINDEALDIALEIGLLYDAAIVDELHIARKQYLDGSIPTGFQRTAITCVGGKIPYKDRIINLIQMSIEEDSCREQSDIGHRRVYLTDRLGMPLIETVTHPEMKTPQEIAEVNDIIRKLARSTGRVRTGMGAGREDVNVSVEGGTRIEIKGVAHIKKIPLLAYNEAMRQWNLLRLREELKNRGITEDTFDASYKDVTPLLRKTRYQPVYDSISQGKVAKAVLLKGFNELLKWQTQTDTYFSKEISDRVRVIACLTTLPNIIHSDNSSENLAAADWRKLKQHLKASEKDAVVVVWGSEEDTETGAKEIIIRAKEATIGIPSETRQALWDGTNGFERILPGPERMYPDTDLPPKAITEERLQILKDRMPEQIWVTEEWYKKIGVPFDCIEDLKISKHAKLFKVFVNELEIDPKLAAATLIQFPKRLKKRGLPVEILDEHIFTKIMYAYKNEKITKGSILYLMEKILRNQGWSDNLLQEPASDEEIKTRIKVAATEMKNIELRKDEKATEVKMGLIMDDLRERVNGEKIAELLGFKEEAE
jgi:glutamyl-tRNA(Gln) amidotransferase subunit E